MGPIEIHVQRLTERAPGAVAQQVPGTGVVIRVPDVSLPDGWSKTATSIRFVAPQGYPFAQPDCFWADADLRLRSGAIPQNAQLNNPIPGVNEPLLWFSWHLQSWNANRDDLVTWFTVIRQRLARAQ